MNLDRLKKQLQQMAHSPIRNYATAGLTSQLIGGEKYGKVRMFTADRDTREFITPHSHRYDFLCLVIAGEVTNTLYDEENRKRPGSNEFTVSSIEATKEFGKFWSREVRVASFTEYATKYVAGEMYEMDWKQIHSINFSKGAVVLFLEGPEQNDYSYILEPFSDGAKVPTFNTPDWMFKVKS